MLTFLCKGGLFSQGLTRAPGYQDVGVEEVQEVAPLRRPAVLGRNSRDGQTLKRAAPPRHGNHLQAALKRHVLGAMGTLAAARLPGFIWNVDVGANAYFFDNLEYVNSDFRISGKPGCFSFSVSSEPRSQLLLRCFSSSPEEDIINALKPRR